jgi:hypothetical protein
MRRWLIILGMIVAAVPAFSLEEPELPQPSDNLPSDIEPPPLLQNLASDDSTLDPRSPSAIEDDLTRARKRAASADRLFRAGIIAKVEAEQRVLRVVQLEAMLAEVRLEEARKAAAETGKSESEIAGIAEAARIATERCHRAEIEAALRNLQRQKKLLALGSANKSDVNRAEEKLAKLQHPAN